MTHTFWNKRSYCLCQSMFKMV